MSRFNISPEKESQLMRRMERLQILESDLVEKFITGAGKGGQKQNKTASCVYLLHLPSRTEVKCQRERSQLRNRFFARRELCDRIEEQRNETKSRKRQAMEKIRRQKRRRSRRSKQRMLDEKNVQGQKRQLRKSVNWKKES